MLFASRVVRYCPDNYYFIPFQYFLDHPFPLIKIKDKLEFSTRIHMQVARLFCFSEDCSEDFILIFIKKSFIMRIINNF